MMDKLLIGTAGIPMRTKPRKYEKAFDDLIDMNLDGMEVEFVRGVNMNPATVDSIKNLLPQNGLTLTAHGPYYINLNSDEQEKIDASVKRILDTAGTAYAFGGYSITFHAAYYMKRDKDFVYNQVKKKMTEITDTLKEDGINIWVRPETTGKATQWGDLDEIVKLSKEVDMVLPCVDFSHLHARSVGSYNTYDEFCAILEKMGNEIGQVALDNFHGHLAGIEYGPKGEKNHLIFEESDMDYKGVLKALKDFEVKGMLICESPNIEEDAMLLKQHYESL